MPSHDPRFDQYIAKSAEFARPILTHIREVVHTVCPEVEEVMKWSFPNFTYRGQILCQMASFKAHASFGFWQAKQVLDAAPQADAMGNFGKLTSVKDLPAKAELRRLIRKAMTLIEEGVKAERPRKAAKPALKTPADVLAALRKAKGAMANWEAFPPSHRREYLEWILGAKQEATRARRIATTVAQVAEGKAQNWKYQRTTR